LLATRDAMFPIPYIPEMDYRGSRGWNADRSKVAKQLGIPGGVLKHAACDLVAPPGTPVLAVADGFVREAPYRFYPKEGTLITYAFSVQHKGFVARYCEIAQKVEVKPGDYVLEGQVIAYIGDQPGYDMLHLELYEGTEFGELSTPNANAPFFRRKDVFDPTPSLDRWKPTAVWRKTAKWKFKPRDAEGRLFLEDV
jgi:murein DD-endopeptidase MepM/ murein hydrolase activator NlpD